MEALSKPPSAEINQAMERFEHLTMSLTCNASNIGAKIDSVMRRVLLAPNISNTSGVMPISQTAQPSKYSAPLANQIDALCEQLQATTEQLSDYSLRVEL